MPPPPIDWKTMRSQLDPADAPKSAAIKILRLFGTKLPPIRVEPMILRLGIQLRRTPKPGWMSALNPTIDPPYIWIAEELDPLWQRMAIALEFGRLLLQPNNRQYTDQHFAQQGDAAMPLNFAMELMAPLFLLEPITIGSRRTLNDLAVLFKVPNWVIHAQLKKIVST